MQVICNTSCYETDGKLPLLSLLQFNGVRISADCRMFLIEGRVKTPEGIIQAPGSFSADQVYPLEDCMLVFMSESRENADEKENDFDEELTPFSFNLGMAVDIGATTVAIDFYDLDEGVRVVTEGVPNRQRSIGADIAARIEYASSGGADALKRAVLYSINEAVEMAQAKYGVYSKNINSCVVTGNSAMLYMLTGSDTSDLFGRTVRAKEIGVDINPNAEVYLAPCVNASVGADVLAGITSSGMNHSGETVMLVDIGTNSEIVLSHRGKLYCASTSASPAFEGANIEFGMIACDGAISEVSEKNGSLMVGVIGGGKPKGICGSGLLDAVAVGLHIEAIDETGLLIGDDGYYLDIETGIEITQRDVREVQLAKSAICSGIAALVEYCGTSFDSIDKLLLAGGFGARLNPQSACDIGLIPNKLKKKIYHIGNSSLKGAGELLLSPSKRYEIERLSKEIEYIELSESEFFSSAFIENMML